MPRFNAQVDQVYSCFVLLLCIYGRCVRHKLGIFTSTWAVPGQFHHKIIYHTLIRSHYVNSHQDKKFHAVLIRFFRLDCSQAFTILLQLFSERILPLSNTYHIDSFFSSGKSHRFLKTKGKRIEFQRLISR